MPEPDRRRSPDADPPESHAERDAPRRGASRARTAAAGSGGRSPGRPGARSWSAVLLALVGFAGVTQVRTNQVDDTYAGLREQDLIDILNGLAGTTQRAQAEIQRLEETRDDLQSDTSARQAALEQARQQAAGAQHPGRHRPGHAARASRITIKEVSGQVRGRPVHRHGAGAAHRRRRGDADQRRGPGGRPDLVRGRHRRAARRRPAARGAVHGRRDRQRPTPWSRRCGSRTGPQDQFAEDDGAELTFEEVTVVRHRDHPGAGRG